MSVIGDLLFFKGFQSPSLEDVFSHQKTKILPTVVAKITSKQISERGLDSIVESLVAELTIEKLDLDTANGTSKIDEISIAGVNHWGERYSAPGLRITKSFVFSGDRTLWELHAGSYSLSPPRGKVGSNALTLGMEVRAEDQQNAVNHIKATLTEVQQYIEQQAQPINAYNDTLPTLVRAALVERQATFQKIDNIKNSLDDI